MSRLHHQDFPCTGCGATVGLGIVASINADRRPDLRDAVLDDSYQRGQCEACGKPFRVEPDLIYLDAGRRQWILVRPARHLPQWAATESLADVAFDRSHGDDAPPDAREPGLTPRLAFGWAAFREKLLCAAHGLDDITLEMLKLAVMRAVSDMPLDDDMELRLTGVSDEALTLGWGLSGGDLAVETLEVPRALHDEIARDEAGVWSEVRAELASGAFVDVNRLLVPQDEAA